jgi:hypothetical protein
MTLLIAAIISVLLWFIPYLEILGYPFRLFVTFIHEGSHALAAVLTGHSVQSLSVSFDTSGLTKREGAGLLANMFISSAGYMGAMAFGALLLFLIRKSVKSRFILTACGVLIALLTLVFGVFTSAFTFEAWSGIPFTLLSGGIISAGLFLMAKFATKRVATFLVSFLAVQCVLNALLDLKTIFFLSTPFAPTIPNDALNMASYTGIPAILWAGLWIALALGILWWAMRLYVSGRDKGYQPDLPFEETPPI